MTMSRRNHRFMTVSASVVALTLVPGVTAVASAHDAGSTPASEHNASTTRSILSDTQTAAIEKARADYLAAAAAARTTLRSSLDAIWTSIKSETSVQRDAADAAKAAYRAAEDVGLDTTALKTAADQAEDAYRAALDAAGAKYQAQADAARSAARSTIDAAAAAYADAVAGIFAGESVPTGLLDAPSVTHRHWASTDHDSGMGNAYGRPGHLGSGPGNSDFGRSGGNGHHGSVNGPRSHHHSGHAFGHSMIR